MQRTTDTMQHTPDTMQRTTDMQHDRFDRVKPVRDAAVEALRAYRAKPCGDLGVNIASQFVLHLGIALRLPSASSTCHHSAEAIEHTAISPSAFRPERPSASPMASAPAGRAEAGAAHEPKPADSEPTPLARAARTPVSAADSASYSAL